jgi:hypothetical protein
MQWGLPTHGWGRYAASNSATVGSYDTAHWKCAVILAVRFMHNLSKGTTELPCV